LVSSQLAAIFRKSSNAQKDENSYPDLELTYGSFLGSLVSLEPNRDYFEMTSILVAPKSVGSFKLGNKSPFADPIINPNYYAHSDDMERTIEGNFEIKNRNPTIEFTSTSF